MCGENRETKRKKHKGELELWTFTLSNAGSGVVASLSPRSSAKWIPSTNHFESSFPFLFSCHVSISLMLQPRALVGLVFSVLLHLFYIYIPHHIPQQLSPGSNQEIHFIKIQMQSVTVKAFLCQANQQSLCPLLPPSGPNQSQGFFKPSKMMKVVQRRKRDNGFAVGCARWSLEAELQRELEAEMKQQQEERQRIGMGRFRHKCEEGKGLVDYLECLEREAIMGEDVGKEPLDYNRRAQIFDRSSRVFQALRQHDDASVSSPQQSSK